MKKVNTNAVIFFHKNIKKIYKKEWINKCVQTVLEQTDISFDIFEINYGNKTYSVFEDFKDKLDKLKCGYFFYSLDLNNHIEAMCYLLNRTFNAYKYEYVFNTNLDDYYKPTRFKEQIDCLKKNPEYIMCSCMWESIDSNDTLIKVYKPSDIKLNIIIDNKYICYNDIVKRLNKDKNVINHSGVCFSKKLWSSFDSDNNLLRYRNDKPYEDLSLWKRVINGGHKITIINKNLITYRIHSNQITTNKNNSNMNKSMDLDYNFKANIESRRIGIFVQCVKSQIKKLKKYLKNINEYFLKDLRKIFFILTDEEIVIQDEFNKYNFEYYITTFKTDIETETNIKTNKYLNMFYPKIELVCDLLYWIPIDSILKTHLTPEQMYLDSNELFICYKSSVDSITIFGSITHYYLKFANSKLSIEDFVNKYIVKCKIIEIK